MTRIVWALVALSFTTAFVVPDAAEAVRHKKKKYYSKTYAQSRSASGYYEMNPDKLPYGTTRWWQQMDFENRGGR